MKGENDGVGSWRRDKRGVCPKVRTLGIIEGRDSSKAKGKRIISIVPGNLHRAYHMLFAWAHPPVMVAHILNIRWLCHSEVLVPIPTSKLPDVLAQLKNAGIHFTEDELGITDEHRKYYRTPPKPAE